MSMNSLLAVQTKYSFRKMDCNDASYVNNDALFRIQIVQNDDFVCLQHLFFKYISLGDK